MRSRPRILVVDDRESSLDTWRRALQLEGYEVAFADGVTAAVAHIRQEPVDLVFTDMCMPSADQGLALLAAVKAAHPATPVIVHTAYGNPDDEVAAFRLGAEDYIGSPEVSVVVNAVRTALRAIPSVASVTPRVYQVPATLVAESPGMKAVLRLVTRAAAQSSSVLIVGETGTGKELVARALHANSPRAAHPFVAVNCGAIPAGFAEAELFGHRKGAFTSAFSDRPGLCEEAHQGTLFLDEVGELPKEMQPSLLRFLDSGDFRRLGENRVRRADVRLVAATNRPLERHVAEGSFRADLYYRLSETICAIPPLRARPEDIRALVRQWSLAMAGPGADPIRVTPAAIDRLTLHDWPGNVRELTSVLARALLASARRVIDINEIEGAMRPMVRVAQSPEGDERRHLLAVLAEQRWHIGRAAEVLGISRWTLRRRMRALDPPL